MKLISYFREASGELTKTTEDPTKNLIFERNLKMKKLLTILAVVGVILVGSSLCGAQEL